MGSEMFVSVFAVCIVVKGVACKSAVNFIDCLSVCPSVLLIRDWSRVNESDELLAL